MLRRSSLLSILTLFALTLIPVRASAAVKGISVTPAVQEVTLEAGKEDVTFTFGVTNSTTGTASLRLSMLDFGSLNESGGVAFLGRGGSETTTYGLRQWMALEKETLTLQPNESQEVRAIVTNKSSLAPGGHYGAIVITSEQDSDEDSESVAVLPSTSVLVLLKKTGGERLELNLPSVSSNKSAVKLPTEISLRFQNGGNTHVVPRGTVKLQGPRKNIIARGIINEESGYILPDSYRVYKLAFTSPVKGWLPGRYNLITTSRYDGQAKAVTTVTHIWYIGLIPIIFLSIIVFIICALFVQRRFIRKNTKK